MDLASINVATKNAFAAAFASEGVLAIGRVNLPRTFQPDTTDVIFLQVPGGCEVYVDSRILYTGTDLRWREIMSQPDAPGNARFVVAGIDFFAALRLVTDLLAGESTQGQDARENDRQFTWLQTLGLSGSPTAEQVKKAFRRLAMKHHPDKLVGASPSELEKAGARMRAIVEAQHGLLSLQRHM